jgi:hypothetical protein
MMSSAAPATVEAKHSAAQIATQEKLFCICDLESKFILSGKWAAQPCSTGYIIKAEYVDLRRYDDMGRTRSNPASGR